MVAISWGTAAAPTQGWLSHDVWPFVAGGALSLLGYGLWAARSRRPIVDLRLLKARGALLSLGLIAVVSVVTFAMIFLAPAFMQDVEGQTAATAGLALLPQGLVTGLGIWIGMGLADRWGLGRTVVVGMVLLTLGTVGLLAISSTSSPVEIATILCGRAFAIGLVIQPLLTHLIDRLPEHQVADANTLFNLVERVAGTLGIAAIVTLFQHQEEVRTQSVLERLHLPPSLAVHPAAARGLHLSAASLGRLGAAATLGLHDVVWWVVGFSVLGLTLAWGIARRGIGPAPAPSMSTETRERLP
jgi:predicted MFS family arabinose efflux permease